MNHNEWDIDTPEVFSNSESEIVGGASEELALRQLESNIISLCSEKDNLKDSDVKHFMTHVLHLLIILRNEIQSNNVKEQTTILKTLVIDHETHSYVRDGIEIRTTKRTILRFLTARESQIKDDIALEGTIGIKSLYNSPLQTKADPRVENHHNIYSAFYDLPDSFIVPQCSTLYVHHYTAEGKHNFSTLEARKFLKFGIPKKLPSEPVGSTDTGIVNPGAILNGKKKEEEKESIPGHGI